jgi:hypothetical protein
MGLGMDLDVYLNVCVGRQLNRNTTLNWLILNRLDLIWQKLLWLDRLHLTDQSGLTELRRTDPAMPSEPNWLNPSHLNDMDLI